MQHSPHSEAQLAYSSPLVLPESSQSIWLMVRFCRAAISEIMSLDLRRSSICTDCHRPRHRTKKKKSLCLCALPCTSLSRQAESALVRSLEKVVTWECKTQVWKLWKAAETQLPVLPDTANLLQSWTAPKQPFI
uniref:Uncharacterized protein n=1 Tax=Anas platyrhynchos platyrhynchos TaxID=8840 RepID=A0A493STC5_ANAPP